MFTPRSMHRATWCLLLASAVLLPAAEAKDLKLKTLKTQEQTVTLPEGATAPAVKKPADLTATAATKKIGMGTRLEITQSTGDMVDWKPALTIDEAHKYSFRWTIGLLGFPAAEWQVGQGEEVLASGAVPGAPFKPGKQVQFAIDLTQALPAKPSAQPKQYWVRIAPRGEGSVQASSAVDLTYAKPGPAPTFGFDYDMFAYNLTTLVQGKAVGWEFAIYDGATLKASGAGGSARLSPQKPMTADTKLSVGSTSKTITAAAVLRAIEILRSKGKNVTIDSSITPYLPTSWSVGPRVDEITFKDLLRHTSGLLPSRDLYAELKAMIADGPTTANWNARASGAYCNCNFTLFRIILPYMIYGREAIEGSGGAVAAQAAALDEEIAALQEELKTASPAQKPAIVAQIKQLQKQRKGLPSQPAQNIELRTAQLYVEFVQKEVLAKVGLGSAWINPKGPSEQITYYNFDTPSATFAGYSDDTALRGTGAGFWFLSAKEYGKFIGGLRTGKIISAASFQTMTGNMLGMFGGSSDAGGIWQHNGAFTYDGGAGVRTAWVMFPNGVTGVLFINSVNWKMAGGQIAKNDKGKPIEELAGPQGLLRDAFNAAFRMQQLAAN